MSITSAQLAVEVVSDTRDAEQGLERVSRRLTDTANAVKPATAEADRLTGAHARVSTSTDRLGGTLGGLRGQLGLTRDGFREATLGAVGLGAGATVLAIGVDKGVEAIRASLDVQANAERQTRSVGLAYGDQAAGVTKLADSLRDQDGVSRNAVLQSALYAGTLIKNYGATADEVQKLISVSSDLSALYGRDLFDTFKRLSDATRGEAESAEEVGQNLNAQSVAVRAAGGAYKNTFDTLSQGQQWQIRYNLLLQDNARFSGAAAKSADTLTGAQSRLSSSTEELGRQLGTVLEPAALGSSKGINSLILDTAALVRGFNDGSLGIQNLGKALNELPEWARPIITGATAGAASGVAGRAAGGFNGGAALTGFAAGAANMVLPGAGIAVNEIARRGQEPTPSTQPQAPLQGWDQLIARAQKIAAAQDGLTQRMAGGWRRIGDTAQASLPPVSELVRQLGELSNLGGRVNTILDGLGDFAGTLPERANFMARQLADRIELSKKAQEAAKALAEEDRKAAQISDPRDAPGVQARRDKLDLIQKLTVAEMGLIRTQEGLASTQEARDTLSKNSGKAREEIEDRIATVQKNAAKELDALDERRNAIQKESGAQLEAIEQRITDIRRPNYELVRSEAEIRLSMIQPARELARIEAEINSTAQQRLALATQEEALKARIAALAPNRNLEDQDFRKRQLELQIAAEEAKGKPGPRGGADGRFTAPPASPVGGAKPFNIEDAKKELERLNAQRPAAELDALNANRNVTLAGRKGEDQDIANQERILPLQREKLDLQDVLDLGNQRLAAISDTTEAARLLGDIEVTYLDAAKERIDANAKAQLTALDDEKERVEKLQKSRLTFLNDQKDALDATAKAELAALDAQKERLEKMAKFWQDIIAGRTAYSTPPADATSGGGPQISITVPVTTTAGGASPEEVARKAAEKVYAQLLDLFRTGNQVGAASVPNTQPGAG